ncbi:hypothetical protein N9Y89_02440 [bacterium]|nr:hypothetical protein [bacterium]
MDNNIITSPQDTFQPGFGKIVFVIRKEFDEAFRSRFSKFESMIEIAYAYHGINGIFNSFANIIPNKNPRLSTPTIASIFLPFNLSLNDFITNDDNTRF